MNPQELLDALREAVARKAAYWDALYVLEVMTAATEEGTWTDRQNDAAIAEIESLAAWIGKPQAAYRMVTEEHASNFAKLMQERR